MLILLFTASDFRDDGNTSPVRSCCRQWGGLGLMGLGVLKNEVYRVSSESARERERERGVMLTAKIRKSY